MSASHSVSTDIASVTMPMVWLNLSMQLQSFYVLYSSGHHQAAQSATFFVRNRTSHNMSYRKPSTIVFCMSIFFGWRLTLSCLRTPRSVICVNMSCVFCEYWLLCFPLSFTFSWLRIWNLKPNIKPWEYQNFSFKERNGAASIVLTISMASGQYCCQCACQSRIERCIRVQ